MKKKITTKVPFELSLSRGNLKVTIIIDLDIIKEPDTLALSALVLKDSWIEALLKGKPKKRNEKRTSKN